MKGFKTVLRVAGLVSLAVAVASTSKAAALIALVCTVLAVGIAVGERSKEK